MNVPNLWASQNTNFSEAEWIDLNWETPQAVKQIDIVFDSMLDFHFAQKLGGYKNKVLPSIIKNYRLWTVNLNGDNILFEEIHDNYQRLCKHTIQLERVQSIR